MQNDLTIERDLAYVTTAGRPSSSAQEINELRRQINDLRRKNEQQRDWMLEAEHLNDCLGYECDCKLDQLLNDREQTDVN